MSRSSNASQVEEIREARKLVADLFTPQPWIYWTDFLVSMTIGYVCASVYLTAFATDSATGAMVPFQWYHGVCFLVSGISLYRVSLMMHEIVHLKRDEMVGFKVTWNLMAGVVMLIPSFLYESHISHHKTQEYGTANDGEYLPLGGGRFRDVFAFLAQILFLPGLTVLRFLIITPLSLLHPLMRDWTLHRASSFVINFHHYRDVPTNAPRKLWMLIDLLCFVRVAVMLALVGMGLTEWPRLGLMYLLAMFILGMNHIRTLVAHHYQSNGSIMSHFDQLVDSVNIDGHRFLSGVLCPLGLRYHALHHLFPSIPYHNLHVAHRRLMAGLPEGSAYHAITYSGFWPAVMALVRNVRRSSTQSTAPADLWYDSRRERAARRSAPRKSRGRSVTA